VEEFNSNNRTRTCKKKENMGIATDAKIGFSQDNEESPLLFPTPPQATAIYGSSSGTDTEGDAENAADEYSPKTSNRSITVIITALLIGSLCHDNVICHMTLT
jgi:hypothetical protein